MLIIKLKGGLGNQMFQYAFGRLLSLKREEELKLDKDILGKRGDTYRIYGLDCFNVKAEIARRDEVVKYKYPYGIFSKGWRYFREKFLRVFHIGYEQKMLKYKNNYIEGFFQSYKYLDPIRDLLIKEFSLKKEIEGDVVNRVINTNSVAIHIRRGDYVNNPKTKKNHFVCDLNYYNSAIKYFKENTNNPVFYIFSDDIAWAKDNFIGDEYIFVSDNSLSDCQELILMSKARHNIISNSSFSFFSAYLNQNKEKLVIAPRIWNRKNDNKFKDLLPPSWKRI